MSEVRLAWDANSEPDIAGYKLHAGLVSGNYDAVGSPKTMGNVTSGGFDIDGSGTWFFALTAYNGNGFVSGNSFSGRTARRSSDRALGRGNG